MLIVSPVALACLYGRLAGGAPGQYGDGWLRITARLTIFPSRTLK